ncbi:hypothetical protein PSRE111525_27885 [Pseudomonas reidholzensis]
MAGAPQADATLQVNPLDQAVPSVKGDGGDQAVQTLEKTCDVLRLAADAKPEGIFEDQGQQFGGGLAAEDRALVTGGEQCRDAADVVEVDVGDDQRADAADVEAQGR